MKRRNFIKNILGAGTLGMLGSRQKIFMHPHRLSMIIRLSFAFY